MKQPFVSCIMPTANRSQFIPYAIDYFLHQDYQHAELIIFDDGKEPLDALRPNHPRITYYYTETKNFIGVKRNFCCQQAQGDIIVHLDDDDWYASDWISRQVNALTSSDADVTGLNNLNFFLSLSNKRWEFRDVRNEQPWVYGATMAYWKSFWTDHPFREMNNGEDNDFIWRNNAKVRPHEYTEGYLGIIHRDNKGIVAYENPREKLQQEKWFNAINGPIGLKNNHFIPVMSHFPLVSCIMPTANRADFIPSAIDNFLKQDYPNKELVIIDDGEHPVKGLVPDDPRLHYFYFEPKSTTGTKRNWACERAQGELIMHWDDDDWYAADWVSYQAHALLNSDADIAGINQVQFFSPGVNRYWMTKNSNSKRPWLTGASLTYRKSFWEKHPFKDLRVGEDDDFVRNSNAKLLAHDYFEGFICTLHPNNTSETYFAGQQSK